MAVQAQYPSNILLLNRNIVQDSKDYSLQPQPSSGGFIEQSHMLFNNNGVGGVNPRKRRREFGATTPTTTTTINNNSLNFSLQNYHHQQQNQSQNQFIDLTQLQNHHDHHNHQHQLSNNVVSTGLRLSFGEQNHQLQQPNKNFSLVYDDFALQFKQETDELFYFLQCQSEQFRRTLANKRQQHYRALLSVAEEALSQRVREKEIELEKATRKRDELEAQAAQLITEAQEWQAKAQAQEAQATSLKAQLQQAMVGPTRLTSGDHNGKGSGAQEVADAESAYADSVSEGRVVSFPDCKMCRTRVATVVILPCRHLCVCRECDNAVQTCPLCFSLKNASVEVYLA